MADNEQLPVQAPPPMTQQDAMMLYQTIQVLQGATVGLMPVHLSKTMSVNLPHIARYETVELEAEKPKSGHPKPEPQFAPAIFFSGSDEPVILTEDQDAVFRPAWERYARLGGQLMGEYDHLFAMAAAATAEAVVDGGEQ